VGAHDRNFGEFSAAFSLLEGAARVVRNAAPDYVWARDNCTIGGVRRDDCQANACSSGQVFPWRVGKGWPDGPHELRLTVRSLHFHFLQLWSSTLWPNRADGGLRVDRRDLCGGGLVERVVAGKGPLRPPGMGIEMHYLPANPAYVDA